MENWLKETKKEKKKKSKKENLLEDGLKLGVGLIGLGIGLHVIQDLD
jgi:hypothetical protein